VAAVLAEVDGDAVGPGAFGGEGEFDRVGFDETAAGRGLGTVAGLAEGGGVVDVDSEEDGRGGHGGGNETRMRGGAKAARREMGKTGGGG
jgi:hypothetical protein